MLEDADVVFLLTTNRADLLRPALAARPGRVDLAVAVDPTRPRAAAAAHRGVRGRRDAALGDVVGHRPHRRCRGGLHQGIDAEVGLFAAIRDDSTDSLEIVDDDVGRALDELLLEEGSALTRSLLGGGDGSQPEP